MDISFFGEKGLICNVTRVTKWDNHQGFGTCFREECDWQNCTITNV